MEAVNHDPSSATLMAPARVCAGIEAEISWADPLRNFLTGLPITGFACLGPAWLLDDEVVFDVRHTGNGGGVFACGGLLIRSVHKTAQLHDAFEGLDFDLEGFHRVVAQKGALHLGCDDRIVDKLTRGIAGVCRLAADCETADRESARQGEQESECR